MRLRYKISVPLAVVMLLVAVTSYMVNGYILKDVEDKAISDIERGKVTMVTQSIERSSVEALELAAVFCRLPTVLQAYQVANQGDMTQEADPKAQEAREMLRSGLKPMLDGFQAQMKEKLKLHFHLPTGRSLARLWRDKQISRNGTWVDISDDIAPFRPSVLDVNKSGTKVKGIELGSGGFEIRGIAPIKDDSGKQLGSVEVLMPFEPILAAASEGQEQDMLLYIPAEGLKIATGLKDPAKNPLVGTQYVLAAGTARPEVAALVTPAFLDQAKASLQSKRVGTLAVSAFPIKDYKGTPAGVMVYAVDVAAMNTTVQKASWTLMGLMGAGLVLILGMVWFITSRAVTRPVTGVISKIKDIADGRADLKDRLDDSQNDEIGELATWFNRLMGKIDEMMCANTGMANMVNAVPDPIFSVDEDYRFLYANTATERYLGKSIDELRKGCCHDFFRTTACKTEKCPIALAKKTNGAFKAEILNIGSQENPLYIEPVGDVLRDCDGRKVGYVEVARVVTDLVLKSQEVEFNMSTMRSIHEQTQGVAARIAGSSGEIISRLEEANQGASHQRNRAVETATAMEEMNATVMEVARNASSAAEQAEATRQKAAEGAQVVHQVVKAIEDVRTLASTLKGNMDQLGDRANGIGQVMTVISDIADQTNLLALNAAIEAARAGEAGRGFAVVADEVRKLAEKTMTATKEVGAAISAIQQGTGDSIRDVDAAGQAVEQAVSLAKRSGDSLQEIVTMVVASTDQVRSIATAAEQQSATSEEINRAVDEVSRIAGETAEGMGASVHAMAELAELADSLRTMSADK